MAAFSLWLPLVSVVLSHYATLEDHPRLHEFLSKVLTKGTFFLSLFCQLPFPPTMYALYYCVVIIVYIVIPNVSFLCGHLETGGLLSPNNCFYTLRGLCRWQKNPKYFFKKLFREGTIPPPQKNPSFCTCRWQSDSLFEPG